MTDKLKEIVDRIRDWTPERQADLADIARMMEEQDKSDISLADEQIAEVRRIMDDESQEGMTLDEFNAWMRDRFGI
jgi:hypothetical protein